MKAELDPVFALSDKIVLPFLSSLRKKLRLGALHSQVHVPGVVVDLPYISHPSLNRVFDYAVGFQNGVPLFDLFIRDGRLRPAFSLLHCRPGQGYGFI